MHPALFIDEIIREFLCFSSEDGSKTLSTLARCCRAWKTPALDYLWARLSSPAPLLQLISGIDVVDGQYVLSHTPTPKDISLFHFYAQRVKHITLCRNMRIHPDIISYLVATNDGTPKINDILPSLRTARVSSIFDPFQLALSLSSQLIHLELDLGFRARPLKAQLDRSHYFLDQVAHVASDLKTLNIRGYASKDVNDLISSIQTLRILSLRTGTSLTHETLLAVARFPLLLELEIHAGHLDVDLLMSSLCDGRGTFPSLRKLHIRASATIIELFMNIIPTNTLQTLHIEAEDPADVPINWNPIFRLISSKAANTLQNLTLEHHIELDDLDVLDSTGGTHTADINQNIMSNKPETHISFTTLKDLNTINGLRRLILNTTLPPPISDQEMETLVGWWPALEHLDLGSAPITGWAGQVSKYPMTLLSLIICAQKLPKLASLILPANANVACTKTLAVVDNISSHRRLARITLGHPSPPDPEKLAQRLYRLFPSLVDVDGLHEHEEQWICTRAALQVHRSGKFL